MLLIKTFNEMREALKIVSVKDVTKNKHEKMLTTVTISVVITDVRLYSISVL